MQRSRLWDANARVGVLSLLLVTVFDARAQQTTPQNSPPGTEQGSTIAVSRALLERLQTQILGLAEELKEVRSDQIGERAEIAELRRQITAWSAARIDVTPAALGDDSVLYGAHRLALS